MPEPTTPLLDQNPSAATLREYSLMYPSADREDLDGYMTTFVECYSNVLSLYSGETKARILAECVSYAGVVDPHALFTPESLIEISHRVFTNTDFRGMLSRLTTNFLSRLPNAYQTYMQLCAQFAWAHDIGGHGNPDACMVHSDILMRLPRFGDIYAVLLENKWLLTLLFLMRTSHAEFITKTDTPRAVSVPAYPVRVTE